MRGFKGGTALFTMPPPPIKCAGAPQKIMYLADGQFRRAGVRDKTKIIYAAGRASIFAVKEYAATLDRVCERKGIERHFKYNLVELRPEQREARFVHLETKEEKTIRYDMIHVTPPQGPPSVTAQSPLADAAGWVEVDKHTLQHARYPQRVLAGRREQPADLAHGRGGPRGGAGARRQPARGHGGTPARPRATTATPPARSRPSTESSLLCEFDYALKPTPTFPLLDGTKEQRAYYWLKRYGLPAIYWHGMMRGIA